MKRLLEKLPVTAICVIALAIATPSSAAPTPYGNAGTENPELYTFTAENTGNVIAYFVGQTAAYGSVLGMSINGAAPLVYGLQNHMSAYGEAFNLGSVNAGDTLRFVLDVSFDYWGPPLSEYTVYSDASWNPAGENLVYSAAYGGDLDIPTGTYVGFEDIMPVANGDRDYDDHQFVFTNVKLTRGGDGVPDSASTLALMGFVIAGLAAIRRRVAP